MLILRSYSCKITVKSVKKNIHQKSHIKEFANDVVFFCTSFHLSIRAVSRCLCCFRFQKIWCDLWWNRTMIRMLSCLLLQLFPRGFDDFRVFVSIDRRCRDDLTCVKHSFVCEITVVWQPNLIQIPIKLAIALFFCQNTNLYFHVIPCYAIMD